MTSTWWHSPHGMSSYVKIKLTICLVSFFSECWLLIVLGTDIASLMDESKLLVLHSKLLQKTNNNEEYSNVLTKARDVQIRYTSNSYLSSPNPLSLIGLHYNRQSKLGSKFMGQGFLGHSSVCVAYLTWYQVHYYQLAEAVNLRKSWEFSTEFLWVIPLKVHAKQKLLKRRGVWIIVAVCAFSFANSNIRFIYILSVTRILFFIRYARRVSSICSMHSIHCYSKYPY